MASKKIVCVCPNPAVDTFAFIDEMKSGSLNRITAEKHFAGGKGIHVALASEELGEEAIVLGIWAGATGNWLKAECEKFGVKCFGIEVNGWNRINYTFQSRGEWNETEFIGPGPRISAEESERFLQEFKRQLPDAGAIVLSGSWPVGAPEDAYGDMIDEAKKISIPVWIDCSGKLLEQSIQHKPFGIHLNRNEMKDIVPKGFESSPQEYLLHFVEQVGLTAGKEGLYLGTSRKKIHASCELEKIFSAVGSGDCLTAGLAVAHVRNYSFEQTAVFAVACGSANCLTEDLGMFNRKDVEALLSKVILK